MIPLLQAESFHALACLKDGGAFILKIFDFKLQGTRRLLYNIGLLFDTGHVYALKTSRPCNKERYVVATGFHRNAWLAAPGLDPAALIVRPDEAFTQASAEAMTTVEHTQYLNLANATAISQSERRMAAIRATVPTDRRVGNLFLERHGEFLQPVHDVTS